MHGELYVRNGPYNAVFERYVAAGLAPFLKNFDVRSDCMWIAEEDGERVGAVAVQNTENRPGWAQLRWYFVLPRGRGEGLGNRLLKSALDFAKFAGYEGIFLWTMDDLPTARYLYEKAGFQLVEEQPAPWHSKLVQQKFEQKI
jgi:GNAT superfamily N-acetyltransferase